MKSRRGFTLLEVMITIGILGTMTVLVAQAIQQSIKMKTKVTTQMDDVSHMRDAVRLIQKDINLAYHYRDVEKELSELLAKKSATTAQQQPVTPPGFQDPLQQQQQSAWNQQLQKREVPRKDPETHFVGTGEGINFVTMNNARTVRNTQQADFVEVGYELKECRSLSENGGTSKCIWRRTSPWVDLDVTKGGSEVVLLENVSEFKFRYMGKGKQDWVSTWRSDSGGDGASKGKFPQAVELSITVTKKDSGKDRKYSMQVIVPIHFPNNPDDTSTGQATQAPGFQQQGVPPQ
ncbi:GspJ family type II secretion system protein [Bdellovibrio sp. SKB1291214]|uniref:type II secretion system protein GspJ n=1 Tax=Bdellovibrio sp. SKB1291214 TaxID=1732569 RepID=UPI0020CBEDFD|nr:type II secretion system protein GspJ [Bdellovibrio sp. SKB1291214]UYL08454.1 GspJ family type II secretion system protein [Bdellovibrio sp. SKB1291214]